MPETLDRIESIFAAAVALASAEERAALLERECADDAALRGRTFPSQLPGRQRMPRTRHVSS